MSIVTLDDELIHYEVLGRGKPIFFLHGWVGSWRYWIPTMQAASSLYRAYALDFWGFGDTAKQPDRYTLDEQVRLIGSFMDALGIVKMPLVGHGLGAVVALEFTLRFPDQVDRLMLTGLPISNSAINARLKTDTVNELVDWLLAKLPWIDSVRNEAVKTDPQAIQASFSDLQDLNLADLSMHMAVPCLFVHGQNDPAVELPPADLLLTLPDKTHGIIFEGSGHYPMLDEPAKYNRLLADFLSLPSGTSPRQLQLKEEWKRRIR
jgi:pimeloyl-ACP methyl ester carboxylesterase